MLTAHRELLLCSLFMVIIFYIMYRLFKTQPDMFFSSRSPGRSKFLSFLHCLKAICVFYNSLGQTVFFFFPISLTSSYISRSMFMFNKSKRWKMKRLYLPPGGHMDDHIQWITLTVLITVETKRFRGKSLFCASSRKRKTICIHSRWISCWQSEDFLFLLHWLIQLE